ncbi:AP-5 complex subunit sigma-1 [Petromyzon marinus]|uniref:AP-5 complex subunit sigma-1 n=1 Tax=Petromyzon marinus TaxID=7757 RepID=UPI003F731234
MNRIANSTTHDIDSGIDDPGSAPSTCACCVRARFSTIATIAMVYAVLIHTVSSAGPCRVLYSQVFAAEKLQDDGCEGERLRLLRKERMAAVARQVQAAFQPCSASAQPTAAVAFPGAEPTAAQEAAVSASLEVGALRLPAGDPCDSELTALWLPLPGGGGGGGGAGAAAAVAASALALTLLCEEHDNTTLAESTLRHVRRALLERLLPPVAPAAALGCEALLQADRVDAVLAALLPFGQLLFLNHQFVQSVERELSAYVNVK